MTSAVVCLSTHSLYNFPTPSSKNGNRPLLAICELAVPLAISTKSLFDSQIWLEMRNIFKKNSKYIETRGDIDGGLAMQKMSLVLI